MVDIDGYTDEDRATNERQNPSLIEGLPKVYARQYLAKVEVDNAGR